LIIQLFDVSIIIYYNDEQPTIMYNTVALKKDYKIGSSFCGKEINTYDLPPRRLYTIYKNLPASEEQSRVQIWTALLTGKYKKNVTTEYILPPVIVENTLVTHIILYKKTKLEIDELLEAVQQQTPSNTGLIYKLEQYNASLEQKKQATLKRDRDENGSFVQHDSCLPFKKRAFVQLFI
jgi:hypothetical protein